MRSIKIYNESDTSLALTDAEIRRLLKKVMSALQRERFDIRVIALSEDKLLDMKKTYFHEDVYTDIISFVLDEEDGLEGELYCSPDRIRENAAEFSEKEAREFARVLIHGAAHLCGYRDASDEEKKEMRGMEDRFLNSFYDKA